MESLFEVGSGSGFTQKGQTKLIIKLKTKLMFLTSFFSYSIWQAGAGFRSEAKARGIGAGADRKRTGSATLQNILSILLINWILSRIFLANCAELVTSSVIYCILSYWHTRRWARAFFSHVFEGSRRASKTKARKHHSSKSVSKK